MTADKIYVKRLPDGRWIAEAGGTAVVARGESSVEAHLALLEKLAK